MISLASQLCTSGLKITSLPQATVKLQAAGDLQISGPQRPKGLLSPLGKSYQGSSVLHGNKLEHNSIQTLIKVLHARLSERFISCSTSAKSLISRLLVMVQIIIAKNNLFGKITL